MTDEYAILDDLAALSSDPYKFVLWAFPWGEPGELETQEGPEEWQAELLCKLRDGLEDVQGVIQQAVASGHGVGKSALVAWLILWGISTFEDTTGVVTANTETQLKTKTWVQLGKWHRLFIAKEIFKLTATAIFNRERERTWRIDMVPWSERNTEAFAGLHNLNKRIILVFDEASAIPDTIWETAEGALTDKPPTQIIWAVFGNPTRNTGRFRECFGKSAHRWNPIRVDSREVSFTNHKQIQDWITDYGEDSDFVRVRVRGVFPRAGSMEFIPSASVEAAAKRDVLADVYDPLIIGVDVARFGDDSSVIYIRKGRDARTHPPIELKNVDTMQLASRVTEEYLRYRADAVFVDGGGVGGGVVDRLRMLRVPVVDVQFGAKSDHIFMEDDHTKYAHKRSEMWGAMREWLKGGAIPDDEDLKQQLVGPQYGFNANNEIQLERKEDMKKRGMASPDIADALALTFAYPVVPNEAAGRDGADQRPLVETEYNPFDDKHMAA